MEDKRKVPENHPALDRFNEYAYSIGGASEETSQYILHLLEAIREGSIWWLSVGGNKYEVYVDILESNE